MNEQSNGRILFVHKRGVVDAIFVDLEEEIVMTAWVSRSRVRCVDTGLMLEGKCHLYRSICDSEFIRERESVI